LVRVSAILETLLPTIPIERVAVMALMIAAIPQFKTSYREIRAIRKFHNVTQTII
jgi:hypothetical protein